MNRQSLSVILLAGLLIVSGLILWSLLVDPTEGAPEAENEQFDLRLLMVLAERYAEKLYLAGEAENWDLADTYAHELEDVGEELRDGGYVVHDTPLRGLAAGSFIPAIERVEDAIDAEDRGEFQLAFRELVNACNSCHAGTGYEQIVVQVPDRLRPFPAQRFAP